jgi:hypothetical protein
MEWYDMEWIDLAQDRDQWRVLVNTVMNLRVSFKMLGSSWVAAQLIASQEGLSSVSIILSVKSIDVYVCSRINYLPIVKFMKAVKCWLMFVFSA